MEEPKDNQSSAQTDTPPPLGHTRRPSLQKRLRAETDNFDFDTLLNGAAPAETATPPTDTRRSGTLMNPTEPVVTETTSGSQVTVSYGLSPRPRRPATSLATNESAMEPMTRPPETPPQNPVSRRSPWNFVGIGAIAVVGLGIWFGATHRQDAVRQKVVQNTLAATPEITPPALSAAVDDTESVESGELESGADPAQVRRRPMHTGMMRLHISRALTGPYTYWFVAAAGQASPQQALPPTDAHGRVALTIPAAYNHAGAQMRLLDQSLGKVARLPVTDFSRRDLIVAPVVGDNLLRDEKTTDLAHAWFLEKTAPAQGTLQERDALEGPVGTAGRVLRLDVSALGTQNWHVQCYQTGVNLQEGKTYQLSFWAKADHPRKLSVSVVLDKPNYNPLGLATSVDLTPNWQKYMMPFTAQHIVPNHGRVGFILGDALGTVSLAGITLRPGNGQSVAHPRDPGSAIDVTLADFH
ncbi:MAG: hypothetical protein JWL77_4537 [Chthonomonadaceae bacterium]|nr:hypothetical protein [Chthonomonadaceae bacterium]